MSERIFILPLWIRLWHWSNAVLMLVLTVTGVSLHFASPDAPLVPFRLSVMLHNNAGLAVAGLYVVFVVANIVSGNWWQYVPKPDGFFERCWRQTRFYAYGIFRGEHHPYPPTLEANFNALQQIIYWVVMYLLMPLLIVSGLVFMWPDLAPKRAFGVDGLLPVAVLHYMVGAMIVAFMVAHIYLGTTGTRVSSLFKMMVTGWHEE
ncbi:cytochrome b/b6 domain-containing protein [Rhodoplanes sp. SY1]|uniref:cytochrome b/b6 domain-containing protein n=1 Tax=Rhodoplanes sp. SY1 TaxID=3166646 RepID=UPI0038B508C0